MAAAQQKQKLPRTGKQADKVRGESLLSVWLFEAGISRKVWCRSIGIAHARASEVLKYPQQLTILQAMTTAGMIGRNPADVFGVIIGVKYADGKFSGTMGKQIEAARQWFELPEIQANEAAA